MKLITLTDLRILDACEPQQVLFQQVFLDGFEVTEENLHKANDVGLDIVWFYRAYAARKAPNNTETWREITNNIRWAMFDGALLEEPYTTVKDNPESTQVELDAAYHKARQERAKEFIPHILDYLLTEIYKPYME